MKCRHTAAWVQIRSMPSPTPLASLSEFASGLFASGEVVVFREWKESAQDTELEAVLEAAFRAALEELPGERDVSINYMPSAGVAGMHYLYRLCLALADRSLTEEEVQGVCAAMPAAPVTADEVLSVDLALRYLPEIYRMARAISDTDPMISGLERVATSFPLSSVGIDPHLPADLTLLQRHPSLWGLYLDRVLERQDESRLSHPAVQRGIRDALGMHGGLAPRLSAKLALLAD